MKDSVQQQQGAHSFHLTLEHDTKMDQTLDHKANVKSVEELKEFTFYYQP